jgi:hypothetical protein
VASIGIYATLRFHPTEPIPRCQSGQAPLVSTPASILLGRMEGRRGEDVNGSGARAVSSMDSACAAELPPVTGPLHPRPATPLRPRLPVRRKARSQRYTQLIRNPLVGHHNHCSQGRGPSRSQLFRWRPVPRPQAPADRTRSTSTRSSSPRAFVTREPDPCHPEASSHRQRRAHRRGSAGRAPPDTSAGYRPGEQDRSWVVRSAWASEYEDPRTSFVRRVQTNCSATGVAGDRM